MIIYHSPNFYYCQRGGPCLLRGGLYILYASLYASTLPHWSGFHGRNALKATECSRKCRPRREQRNDHITHPLDDRHVHFFRRIFLSLIWFQSNDQYLISDVDDVLLTGGTKAFKRKTRRIYSSRRVQTQIYLRRPAGDGRFVRMWTVNTPLNTPPYRPNRLILFLLLLLLNTI